MRWRFHRMHCSAFKMLLPVLLALAPPVHLPGLCPPSSLYLVACFLCHRATAFPQLWRLSLFCHLRISHQQLVPGVFHVVKLSSLQWLCNSEQPSAPLVSDLCLHSSAIRAPQLWGDLYHGSCSFTKPVFTEHLLCARHGFKVLN